MKIIEMKAENIQRLKAVNITPGESNVIVIGGRNGQGKTSLLDAIWMALGGKRAESEKPVRDGEEKGVIELVLDDDYVIRKVIKANGSSELEIKTKKGLKYPSPQRLLEGFSAKFAFDPLKFKSLEPKEQTKLLKELVGLDFTDLEKEYKEVYEARTKLNGGIESYKRTLELAAPLPENMELIDLEQVHTKLALAKKEKARQDEIKAQAESRMYKVNILKEQLNVAKAKVRELEQLIETGLEDYNELFSQIEPELLVEDSTLKDLEIAYEEAKLHNVEVAAGNKRVMVQNELTDMEARTEAMTNRLQEIKQESENRISSAKFPIDGLGLVDGKVVYGTIPFSQLSGAEQLRISVAIGCALNPALRVMLIRDGSLLDLENLELLKQLATENDAQIWLERVGSGPEVAVIIEDGTIIEVQNEG